MYLLIEKISQRIRNASFWLASLKVEKKRKRNILTFFLLNGEKEWKKTVFSIVSDFKKSGNPSLF